MSEGYGEGSKTHKAQCLRQLPHGDGHLSWRGIPRASRRQSYRQGRSYLHGGPLASVSAAAVDEGVPHLALGPELQQRVPTHVTIYFRFTLAGARLSDAITTR